MNASSRRRAVAHAASLVTLLVVLCLAPQATAESRAEEFLWVDGANPNCADTLTPAGVSRQTPWCTIRRAAEAARIGDTIEVMPGRYPGTVRPAGSGTVARPIRFLAPLGGVVIDAAGADVAVKIVGVSWISVEGFTVTGAAGQGVYVDDADGVLLSGLDITGNGTYGVQARASGLRVADSMISRNGLAGISELTGSSGNEYEGNTIIGNGKDGRPYNGDGIQLSGTGATIRGNAIRENGDPGLFEHGIYAGPSSAAYLIESNTVERNAGSDIKAAGSGGTIRYNRLADSRLGLVFADNGAPVSAYYNIVAGTFQHAVFLTSGTTAAQAKLWDNTIVQRERPDVSGDSSVVFINAAHLADLRNNIICSAGRTEDVAAVHLKDVAHATLVSNTNWFCGRGSANRRFAVDGVRTTLDGWRVATDGDENSLSTSTPSFDSRFHVASRNVGARKGEPLGLPRDYAGAPVSAHAPDIGAFESSR